MRRTRQFMGVAPEPYRYEQQQQQRAWLGTSEPEEEAARSYDRAALELGGPDGVTDSSRKLEFVNLSLRNNEDGDGGGGCSSSVGGGVCVEREHMFDKVVTPSDVGKLNRLVIPKQHAEKYFPLDSSASDKGLLLNFEDRDGKPWRFRYSYWNSSQSYVMTKGWSRFVKEKKLDAGDIVSFERGVGESGKDRLYIDWRRRPDAPDPTSLSHLHLPTQLPFSQSVRWGRLYSLPQSPNTLGGGYHDYNAVTSGSGSLYYLSSSSSSHQIGAVQQGGDAPMVINSVPVVHGKTTAKRLRLFGVNMECSTPDDHPECNILPSTAIPHVTMASLSPHLPSSSLPPLQLRLFNGSPLQAVNVLAAASLGTLAGGAQKVTEL
ncbi:unnamed protein product, partial [Vitis vinifera]